MKLGIEKLYTIQRLAVTGLGLEDTLLSVGVPQRDIAATARDPAVLEAFNSGAAEGIAAVHQALHRSALEGNVGAIRLLAARQSGVEIETEPVVYRPVIRHDGRNVVEEVNAGFARNKALWLESQNASED
jgi:hypothetical protein